MTNYGRLLPRKDAKRRTIKLIYPSAPSYLLAGVAMVEVGHEHGKRKAKSPIQVIGCDVILLHLSKDAGRSSADTTDGDPYFHGMRTER